MKRNLLFTMGAMLLMAGTVTTACSSDDDVITPTEQTAELDAATKGDGTQLPDAADFIKTVSDTGYVHSYFDEGFWYVKASLPEEPGVIYYDGGICYFMYNLPEDFKIDGKKVKFTGDAYECKDIDKNGDGLCSSLAGYEYYDVVIKEIEIVE
ncbi:MAG: hypothetical protein IKO86_01950 [Prevotella sp.]|nr:hypothetical protein [Prevotella sp.]